MRLTVSENDDTNLSLTPFFVSLDVFGSDLSSVLGVLLRKVPMSARLLLRMQEMSLRDRIHTLAQSWQT